MGGDVHVRVYISKHATFERKGADLFMEKKISLIEALSGTNFEIKHLDGKNLKVIVILTRFPHCHKKF
jgi:DnaJ family protein A protein 2